jgi:hypothetical protein
MTSLRQLSLLVGGLLSLGSVTTAAPVSYNETAGTAPTEIGATVRAKYIVTLKDGLTSRDLESHFGWVNQVHKRNLEGDNNSKNNNNTGIHRTFDSLHVYIGDFDDSTLEQIKSRPDVEAVEEDQIWHPFDDEHTSSPPSNPIHENSNPIYEAFFSGHKDNDRAHHPNAPRDEKDTTQDTTTGTPQAVASQSKAPWGLARLSHRARG